MRRLEILQPHPSRRFSPIQPARNASRRSSSGRGDRLSAVSRGFQLFPSSFRRLFLFPPGARVGTHKSIIFQRRGVRVWERGDRAGGSDQEFRFHFFYFNASPFSTNGASQRAWLRTIPPYTSYDLVRGPRGEDLPLSLPTTTTVPQISPVRSKRLRSRKASSLQYY